MTTIQSINSTDLSNNQELYILLSLPQFKNTEVVSSFKVTLNHRRRTQVETR